MNRLFRDRLLLALLAVALPVCVVAGASCASDGKLTPGAASALNTALADFCPLEAMVPVVGPELVLACPGEEVAVAAALALDTAPATTAPALRSLVVQGKRVGVRVAAKTLPSAVLPSRDAGAEGGAR
jgi:hypothetical protein